MESDGAVFDIELQLDRAAFYHLLFRYCCQFFTRASHGKCPRTNKCNLKSEILKTNGRNRRWKTKRPSWIWIWDVATLELELTGRFHFVDWNDEVDGGERYQTALGSTAPLRCRVSRWMIIEHISFFFFFRSRCFKWAWRERNPQDFTRLTKTKIIKTKGTRKNGGSGVWLLQPRPFHGRHFLLEPVDFSRNVLQEHDMENWQDSANPVGIPPR